jgi:hypothetical protein
MTAKTIFTKKRETRQAKLRTLLFSNKDLLNSLRIQTIPDEQLERLAERVCRTGQIPVWIKDPKLLSQLVEIVNNG